MPDSFELVYQLLQYAVRSLALYLLRLVSGTLSPGNCRSMTKYLVPCSKCSADRRAFYSSTTMTLEFKLHRRNFDVALWFQESWPNRSWVQKVRVCAYSLRYVANSKSRATSETDCSSQHRTISILYWISSILLTLSYIYWHFEPLNNVTRNDMTSSRPCQFLIGGCIAEYNHRYNLVVLNSPRLHALMNYQRGFSRASHLSDHQPHNTSLQAI